jgi:hypothetical protein
MKPVKVYFIPPTRHTAPNGPIALGNIIKDPRAPELIINDPDSEGVLKLASKFHEVDETSAATFVNQGTNLKGGVFAKFLEGFSLDTGAHSTKEASIAYNFDKLTIQSISPSLGEIKTIFDEPAVQDAIKNSILNARVFMITAIQVAYGADVIASTIKDRGGFLHFRADLTPAGAPVNVGAAMEASKKDGQIFSSRISEKTPFVVAYRLREIVYRRSKVREQKEVTNGDLMGTDGGKADKKMAEDPSTYVADVSALRDEDPKLPKMWELNPTATVDEEGEECHVVVVKEISY